jgi:hypothetical protein
VLGSLPANRGVERLCAEIDQERSTGELEREERRLEGDDQGGNPDARCQRPDRLSARDAERREDARTPSSE